MRERGIYRSLPGGNINSIWWGVEIITVSLWQFFASTFTHCGRESWHLWLVNIKIVGTIDLYAGCLRPSFPPPGGLWEAAAPWAARQSRPPWSNCTFSSYPTSSVETRTVNDPPDILDRQKCLTALASLRHAKWFQVCIHVLICALGWIVSVNDLCSLCSLIMQRLWQFLAQLSVAVDVVYNLKMSNWKSF